MLSQDNASQRWYPASTTKLMTALVTFEALRAGVRIFRYQPGFLHQKALLIDHDVSMLGSANLDNRSFRLNFEITAFVPDKKFIGEVREMLKSDFDDCVEVKVEEFTEKPFLFKAACRAARLMAPLQ